MASTVATVNNLQLIKRTVSTRCQPTNEPQRSTRKKNENIKKNCKRNIDFCYLFVDKESDKKGIKTTERRRCRGKEHCDETTGNWCYWNHRKMWKNCSRAFNEGKSSSSSDIPKSKSSECDESMQRLTTLNINTSHSLGGQAVARTRWCSSVVKMTWQKETLGNFFDERTWKRRRTIRPRSSEYFWST